MHAKSLQSCAAFCNPMDCSPLSVGFPRQNTGVGCHALLQGIFLAQGSYLQLLHHRQILNY